jgi:hypothetical protein
MLDASLAAIAVRRRRRGAAAAERWHAPSPRRLFLPHTSLLIDLKHTLCYLRFSEARSSLFLGRRLFAAACLSLFKSDAAA